MTLPRLFRSKIGQRILRLMLLVSLLPLLVLGLYALRSVNAITTRSIERQQELLLDELRSRQLEAVAGQAALIDQEFAYIEQAAGTLEDFCTLLYHHPERFTPQVYGGHYEQHPTLGVWWAPEDAGHSAIFISTRATVDERLMAKVYLSEHMDFWLKQIILNHPNVVSAYINTEDNFTRLYPWFSVEEAIEYGILVPDSDMHDPAYIFYWLADAEHNPERTQVWTDVYLDPVGRGWMVSCVSPVYLPDDTLKGVVGLDVTTERIVQNVIGLEFDYPSAYAFLLSSNGQVIGFPERAAADLGWREGMALSDLVISQSDSPVLRQIATTMTAHQPGQQEVILNEQQKFFFYAPIPTTGWSLGFVVPLDEAMESTHAVSAETRAEMVRLRTPLLVGAALTFVLAALVSVAFSRRITHPIAELAAGANALAEGDLEARIEALSQGDDELADLARTFNMMGRRIQEDITRLQELDRMKDEFISSVSHELRTPLAAIMGFVEQLQMGRPGPLTDVQQEFLDIIAESARRLHLLVADLLDVSQLDTGRFTFDFTSLSPSPLFRERAEAIRPQAEQKGLRLVVDVADDLPTVTANADRVKQVLDNLTSNAIKFTPAGEAVLMRAFAVRGATPHDWHAGYPEGLGPSPNLGSGDWLFVSVTDTGPGISPQDLPRIFSKFHRGDLATRQAAGGTGLGLYICKGIIEGHGGRIGIHSLEGRGTTVWFALPLGGPTQYCPDTKLV